MAKTDYLYSSANNRYRLMIYQSDIQNSTAADPYVNVSVYLQVSESQSGFPVGVAVDWSASLLGSTYTASGGQDSSSVSTFSGWKTVKTIFSQKGIWSVSKTRTSFSVNFTGRLYYAMTNINTTFSGTISMQAWPVSGTKDTMSVTSSMTMGTAYTISITHKTSGNKNTLKWTFGSQSGTLLSSSTATSVSWTPATSLGAQIPSASSGTVTFTLTTYNSAGTSLGSTTYTSKLSVPSYSLTTPTVSAAKNTYTTVGAYVANKTKTRFTLSGLPSGTYGATVSGSYVIKLGSVQQTSGTKTGTSASNVDYTASAAGALTLTYTIKDSRGKTASKAASVTYVANASPTISFSVARDADTPTTWVGTTSGTYLNVSGNTPTITYSTGTATAPTASAGSYSGGSVTGTLAETSSLSVKATVTDTLGNTASKSITIPTVFAYIEATPNKVISIGRKASTDITEKIQLGLPVDVEGIIKQTDGGRTRTLLGADGLTFYDSNGSEKTAYDPAYQEQSGTTSVGTGWTLCKTLTLTAGLWIVNAGLAYYNTPPRGVAIVGKASSSSYDYNLAVNENYASITGSTVSWLWCGTPVRITGTETWQVRMYAKSANAATNRVYMSAMRIA